MAILQTAPEGAEVIDIAAARAARAEVDATLPPVLVKIDAGYVQLSREIDVLCADDFTDGHIRAGLAKILQDPADIDAIVSYGLSKDDLEQIVNYITGKTLGE